jgi:hypothetical protein
VISESIDIDLVFGNRGTGTEKNGKNNEKDINTGVDAESCFGVHVRAYMPFVIWINHIA